MTFVDLRSRLDEPDVRQLLAVLAWTGAAEHLDRICAQYRGDRILLGYDVDGLLVGCVGLEDLGDGRAVVCHIAVDAMWRRQGVGRAMVEHARTTYGMRSLVAETDREAVGFYERCGFAIRSLGELHPTDRFPSAERFRCTLGQPPT